MMNETQIRQELIQYALKLNTSGLSSGKSGNASTRYGDGMLITPSAIEYHELACNDIVYLDLAEEPAVKSNIQPSSEWRFHRDVYLSRKDINAIVHTHSTYCTALACTGRSIPAFHYMVAIAGGKDIPIAPYALFGTEQLSKNVVLCLRLRQACLMANHGMIAIGNSLPNSFKLAAEIEVLAEQYCEALKLGAVNLLNDQQMDEVLDKFVHYGQRV
jgi:L-fuculose-phosphate aldolase